MIFKLLQKRFGGGQTSIPQYITRDIILNKVKSNTSSADESFKIKINKKGEQILTIKLNPSKKNEDIIAKIKNLISNNHHFEPTNKLLNVEIKSERVFFDKEHRIGSGTYSNVYLGQYLGTEVAVKRFRNSDSASLKAWG